MKKFKRILAVVFSIALVFTSVAIVSTASNFTIGDVTSDSKVNMADVLALRKYLAKWTITIDEEASDVNFDGKINMADVLVIRKHLARIIPVLTRPNDATDATKATTVTTTTQGTTSSEVFPTEQSDLVVTSQVGYANTSEKIARVMCEKNNTIVECRVVNADTKEVVLSGSTTKAKIDAAVSEKYIGMFDFSSVTATGKYYISTPYGVSHTFEIEDQPYNEAQDAIITALYYNRCGCDLDEAIVGKNYVHTACHANAAKPAKILNVLNANTGKYTFDKSKSVASDVFKGGLHDAGDYGRYVTPANQVVADCLFAYEMFKNGCTTNVITDKQGENIADVLDEARYEMEWIMRMQNPENGGVYFRIGTSEFAGWTETPTNDSLYNSQGLLLSRESIKATAGAAGAAAQCYVVFKDIDADFANRCLTFAKKAYDFVVANENNTEYNKSTPTNDSEAGALNAGEYGSTEFYGDWYYAAAALYRATGDEAYNTKFKQIYDAKINVYGFDIRSITAYSIGGAGSWNYLLNDKGDDTYQQNILAKMKSSADTHKTNSGRDKFASVLQTGGYVWGSNASISNILKNMAAVDYFSNTTTYEGVIRDVVNYFLGANPSGYSFVTGVGSKSPMQPHHRPSIYARHNGNNPPVPGWVVGGIYGKSYEDAENNYQTNEVCVYWNTSPMVAFAYVIEKDKK